MCGLAGLLGTPWPLHAAAAEAMDKALAHRGPDGAGRWSSGPESSSPCTLVHRRLAIQDLSAAGQQPMASACGRWQLVFNGEIYNQHALRADLERLGHRFHSSSDTEVLLQHLIRYGSAGLQRLRGMYAFCLVDTQQHTALLARDPYGIKPLHLWQGPGGQLVFASELRALLASGLVPRQLDPQALAAYLRDGSLPEPLTLVAGVRSLPPGYLGQWCQGHWQVQPHWRPSYNPGLPLSRPQAIALTRQALEAAVQAHQLSDVPVGLFLSGGLDSASLLALAGGSRLTTLSIGFHENAFNEAPRAAALARHFGSRHVELQLEAPRAAALLPAFLAAVDQPSVDGFNTYCVSQLAAEQGLKVVLSGLGGDELFGGYPSFRRLPQLLQGHRRLGAARPALARWLARSGQHQRQRLSALLQGPATARQGHQCLRGLFSPSEVQRILRHWGLEPSGGAPLTGLMDGDPQPGTERFPQLADAIAWLESSAYMGQQLLRDSDTFSMAHGLELRIPFVDSQLFRELTLLPAEIRLAAGKQLLQEAVPEVLRAVPPQAKKGFSFPFALWLDQANGFLIPGSLETLMPPLPPGLDRSPWARRWGLMVLQHWLRQHLSFEFSA